MKTVFFDIDDTIYDRSSPFRAAVGECFGTVPEDVYSIYLSCTSRGDEVFLPSQRGEISMDEMYIYRWCRGFADHGIELSPEGALEFQKSYARNQKSISLSSTMPGILECAAGRFEQTGIITNGPAEKQRGKIAALGIEGYFRPELILISGELKIDKPDPEIFRLARRLCGCRPEEILYVGDSPYNDIIPAAAEGWHTLWYNRRGAAMPAGSPAPDRTCSSEEELLEILKNI